MEIGVTGATGLVGRYFIREALEAGCSVRFLRRSSSPVSEELESLGASPVDGDLSNLDSLTKMASGCEVVVHCAASTSSAGTASNYRAVNLTGTRNALDSCRMAGVRRFVHVSTPSVLVDGTHQIGVSENYQPLCPPIGLYAATKFESELLVRAVDGLEWTILRPKAVFGIGDRTLLPEVFTAIRRRRLFRIGNDRVIVGLTHASDVAKALLAATQASQAAGQVFHIDGGEAVDLWALLHALKSAMHGSDKPLHSLSYGLCMNLARVADASASLRRGPTDMNRYRVAILGRSQTLDISAAKRGLGYVPQASIVDSMAKTLHHDLGPLVSTAFEQIARISDIIGA